jgi:predicted nucleotide-binding protein
MVLELPKTSESQKMDKVTSDILKAAVKSQRGRKAGTILFPRNSLNDALRIPNCIWIENSGNPFPIMDIASKVGYSPTTGLYRELLRSAQRYGLTNESYTNDLTNTISLTALGQSLAAPNPDENVNVLKRKALETSDLFRVVLASIQGKIIPPADSFKNMLIRNHHLDKEDADACYEILKKNIDELGIADIVGKNTYLRLDKLGTGQALQITPVDSASTDEGQNVASFSQQTQVTRPSPPVIEVKVPRVFISHSKNKNILNQIKQMLEFGKFQYDIAEERETTAMPLSDKVFNIMWECNCAIINISADVEKKHEDTFGINENVIAELWGAYLHYRKRVILVIDKRLKEKLPSIMQGLTAIFYEGDELSWGDGMRLQNALSEFRNQL